MQRGENDNGSKKNHKSLRFGGFKNELDIQVSNFHTQYLVDSKQRVKDVSKLPMNLAAAKSSEKTSKKVNSSKNKCSYIPLVSSIKTNAQPDQSR